MRRAVLVLGGQTTWRLDRRNGEGDAGTREVGIGDCKTGKVMDAAGTILGRWEEMEGDLPVLGHWEIVED